MEMRHRHWFSRTTIMRVKAVRFVLESAKQAWKASLSKSFKETSHMVIKTTKAATTFTKILLWLTLTNSAPKLIQIWIQTLVVNRSNHISLRIDKMSSISRLLLLNTPKLSLLQKLVISSKAASSSKRSFQESDRSLNCQSSLIIKNWHDRRT